MVFVYVGCEFIVNQSVFDIVPVLVYSVTLSCKKIQVDENENLHEIKAVLATH